MSKITVTFFSPDDEHPIKTFTNLAEALHSAGEVCYNWKGHPLRDGEHGRYQVKGKFRGSWVVQKGVDK